MPAFTDSEEKQPIPPKQAACIFIIYLYKSIPEECSLTWFWFQHTGCTVHDHKHSLSRSRKVNYNFYSVGNTKGKPAYREKTMAHLRLRLLHSLLDCIRRALLNWVGRKRGLFPHTNGSIIYNLFVQKHRWGVWFHTIVVSTHNHACIFKIELTMEKNSHETINWQHVIQSCFKINHTIISFCNILDLFIINLELYNPTRFVRALRAHPTAPYEENA